MKHPTMPAYRAAFMIAIGGWLLVGCTPDGQPAATPGNTDVVTTAAPGGAATSGGMFGDTPGPDAAPAGAESDPSADSVGAGPRVLDPINAPPECADVPLEPGPANEVRLVDIVNGAVGSPTVQPLAADAFHDAGIDPPPTPTPAPTTTAVQRLHPYLRQLLDDRINSQGRLVPVLITYRDNLRMPRFPQLPEDEAARACAGALVGEIRAARAEDYAAIQSDVERYGLTMLDTDLSDADVDFGFWIQRAVAASGSIAQIVEFAAEPDVVYVSPIDAREFPPSAAGSPVRANAGGNGVADARALIGADAYAAFRSPGTIWLLDTGLVEGHDVFDDSNLGTSYDCVAGNANCQVHANAPDYDPTDWCWDHGTGSAHILAGSDGVTAMRLHSMRVYGLEVAGGTCTDGLRSDASLKALEAAAKGQAHVILAEMQGGGSDVSSLSLAADNVFDTGRADVATLGNVEGIDLLGAEAPSNAHKAIAIGGFDVTDATAKPIQTQRFGPTFDRRVKPDLLAPTNTLAASNRSNDAFEAFGGTSGAAPYGAGAAALIWRRLGGAGTDPGLVYAHLILAGQTPYDSTWDAVGGFRPDTGAGQIRLPKNGVLGDGKAAVLPAKKTVDINFPVSGAPAVLDAAIWWDEYHWQVHQQVDLFLIHPSGAEVAVSRSPNGVFERARVEGPDSGPWKIRIHAHNVDANGQFVYWAAFAGDR